MRSSLGTRKPEKKQWKEEGWGLPPQRPNQAAPARDRKEGASRQSSQGGATGGRQEASSEQAGPGAGGGETGEARPPSPTGSRPCRGRAGGLRNAGPHAETPETVMPPATSWGACHRPGLPLPLRPHSLQTLGGPRAGRAQWVSPPGRPATGLAPAAHASSGPQARLAQALPQLAGGLPRQSCEGWKRLRPSPATRPTVVLGAGGRGMGGQGVYLSSLLNWGWASAISRLLLNIALLQQEQSEKTELLTQPHQAAREAGPPHSSTQAGHGPPGPRPGTRA